LGFYGRFTVATARTALPMPFKLAAGLFIALLRLAGFV